MGSLVMTMLERIQVGIDGMGDGDDYIGNQKLLPMLHCTLCLVFDIQNTIHYTVVFNYW